MEMENIEFYKWEKQKALIIKGMKITAASKKDAIKKYNHKKNQANTF